MTIAANVESGKKVIKNNEAGLAEFVKSHRTGQDLMTGKHRKLQFQILTNDKQVSRTCNVEFTGGETKYASGTVHQLDDYSHPVQREFYDFYRTPRGEYNPKGGPPELTTHPTLSGNVKFNNFYLFNDIETISPRPRLFITGDKAHSKEFSEDAYKRAAEPKELYIVPGAGHVDLYDKTDLIPFDHLTAYFTGNLKQADNNNGR